VIITSTPGANPTTSGMLFFEKNANFFAENCRKLQKIVIITSTPDLASFRQLGDCFNAKFVLKITEVARIFGLLFPTVKVMYVYISFDKNVLGYILGEFYTN
jgi:hypothetical protein